MQLESNGGDHHQRCKKNLHAHQIMVIYPVNRMFLYLGNGSKYFSTLLGCKIL